MWGGGKDVFRHFLIVFSSQSVFAFKKLAAVGTSKFPGVFVHSRVKGHRTKQRGDIFGILLPFELSPRDALCQSVPNFYDTPSPVAVNCICCIRAKLCICFVLQQTNNSTFRHSSQLVQHLRYCRDHWSHWDRPPFLLFYHCGTLFEELHSLTSLQWHVHHPGNSPCQMCWSFHVAKGGMTMQLQ